MRQRITWRKSANAAQPPATPSEAGGHPASQKEPDVSEYGNGDTSSWAEDPHLGPYANGNPPAMPSEAGDHPAARKAAERRAQRKASKCIRIAEVLLGRKATVAMIEDQAYDLMSLPDEALDMTLDRMSPSVEDFDEPSEVFAGEDPSDEEAEKMLAEMLAEEDKKNASKKSEEDEEAEKMLAEMLAEEAKAKSAEDDDDDDAEVASILAELEEEEKAESKEEEPAKEACACDDNMGDDLVDLSVDPLGLDPEFQDDLSLDLFAEEEPKEEPAKEASRTASQKAPKTLKSVVASQSQSDVSTLESLWTTAPDVSKHFGM